MWSPSPQARAAPGGWWSNLRPPTEDAGPPETLQAWQARAEAALAAAGVPSPAYDARALLEAVTGWGRAARLTRAREPLPAAQAQALEALLHRRAAREPLQYLLGTAEWGGLRLRCDPRALIPRPETEWLLHLILNDSALNDQVLNAKSSAPRVLDVGTGTGALALGYKLARPRADVTATDLSQEALSLAAENAALNGLEVTLLAGDLLQPVRGTPPFDLILSNPPYLPEGDRGTLAPEVGYDPPAALYGGPDGLRLARQLLAQAPAALAPAGVVWLELDPRNAAPFAAELHAAGWQAEVHPDLTGRERFVRANPDGPKP